MVEIPVPAAEAATAESAVTSGSIGQLEIHFLRVGQGDCTLVKCPDGGAMLVDCGSKGGDFSSDVVRAYLRARLDETEPKLDLMVVTHPDSDHYNKIPTVVQAHEDEPQIAVERVMLVGTAEDHSASGGFNNWLMSMPSDRIVNVAEDDYNVFPPKVIDVCGQAEVEILAANVSNTFSESNAKSIVMVIRLGAFDAVLTGDATRHTQRDILDRFEGQEHLLGGIEVLKVAHHGSRSTSMLEFSVEPTRWFDTLEPQVAVFSAALDNSHGHPNIEVAQALSVHTIDTSEHPLRFWKSKNELATSSATDALEMEAMFLTATNGTIVVTTDGSFYEFGWDE